MSTKEEEDENAVLWEAFCSFESCVRDTKTESFEIFLSRWEARLSKMEYLGVVYPDKILIMKLSYACNLDLMTVLNLLSLTSTNKQDIKSEVKENGENGITESVPETILTKVKNFLCKVKLEDEFEYSSSQQPSESLEVYFDNEMFANVENDDDIDDVGNDDLDDVDHDIDQDLAGEEEDNFVEVKPKIENLDMAESDMINCDKCEKQFSNEKALMIHQKQWHTDMENCEKCGFSLKGLTKFKIWRHIKKCTESKYKCEECNIPFYNQRYYKQHLANHTELKCDKCETTFMSQKAFRTHNLTSACAELYPCNICNKEFPKGKLRKHKANHHKKNGGMMYPCTREGCTSRFYSQEKLDYHYLLHDNVRSFSCDECPEKFTSESNLSTHKKMWHTEMDTSCERCGKSGKGIPRIRMKEHLYKCASEWRCLPCQMGFSTQKALERHTSKLHTEVRCEKCGSVFVTQRLYRKHMTHSACAEKVACKFCGKLLCPTALKKHEGKHKSDQNIQCPREGCDECFFNKISLETHLRKHDNIRDFHCDQCDRKFYCKLHLTVHMKKVHLNMIKKRECEQCGKQFIGPSKLAIHMRTHTGERPFNCELCDKSFTRKEQVKRHVDVVHNRIKLEPSVKCELCHKEFTKKWNWTQHMKKVHKMEKSAGTGQWYQTVKEELNQW